MSSTTLSYQSQVNSAHRAALESLVFFNACQDRVSASIADAVEKFGFPEIVTEGDRLRVRLSGLEEAQCLFAAEVPSGRPVGLAVYIRPDLEHISVLHLSIASEFATGGPRANEQVLLRLLRELRRSTRRVKGVQRLELYYAAGRLQHSRPRLATHTNA